MIKIAVSGARGRMGMRIIKFAEEDSDLRVVSKFDIGMDPAPEIARSDVLIEFTTPEATVEHAVIAGKLKKGIVVGTTGLSKDQIQSLEKIAKDIPVVFSPNMSVGVNLLFKLSEEASTTLPAEYRVSMIEAHHVHKKDAPSGTAKRLAEIIARNRGMKVGEIPVQSIREGEIIGDHSVIFDSDTESVELIHRAKSRDTFAIGAVKAAKFVYGKKKGLFAMNDVLGIR
ncbi:MAG: 4-hydroxy-tetrahydrodipicolinate reductase [Candidatus Omnitrophica bacterium]|nr:4-hydroxy-tetrahydrodipicolinate reductase [Candidatus Omnitrophota bacterium]